MIAMLPAILALFVLTVSDPEGLTEEPGHPDDSSFSAALQKVIRGPERLGVIGRVLRSGVLTANDPGCRQRDCDGHTTTFQLAGQLRVPVIERFAVTARLGAAAHLDSFDDSLGWAALLGIGGEYALPLLRTPAGEPRLHLLLAIDVDGGIGTFATLDTVGTLGVKYGSFFARFGGGYRFGRCRLVDVYVDDRWHQAYHRDDYLLWGGAIGMMFAI